MTQSDILFVTNAYRISSMRYFGVLFRNLLRNWWSVLVLFFVAIVGGICYDLRMIIVLLMIIFLALPMLLFFLYYNYALRKEAFYSVVEKIVIIHKNGIDCIYDERQREVLKWEEVKRTEIYQDAIYLYTDRYTYFYLSRDSFAGLEELNSFEKIYLPQFIS